MPPRGAKTSADLRAASRAAGRCPRLRPARAVASLPGGGSPRLSAQSEASSPVSFRRSRSVTVSVPSPGRRVAFVLKESALSTRPVSLGFRSRRLKNLGQASPSFGVPLFLAFRKATPNPVGYASLDLLKVNNCVLDSVHTLRVVNKPLQVGSVVTFRQPNRLIDFARLTPVSQRILGRPRPLEAFSPSCRPTAELEILSPPIGARLRD